MLHHVPRRVPPVVEYLTAQDVPPDAPNRLVPLGGQPLVAQVLRVKVVHLERAVVHVRGGAGGHEEGVVVHGVRAAVDVREDGDDFSIRG